MAKYVRAYHFVGDTLRDGRPVPANGEWLTHDGDCVICDSGLHASRDPLDALQYAPGPILCLVDCGQIEGEQNDKFVCRKRRIVARFDATTMLREFARKCALDVIHLWDAQPVVREYLETGREDIRAAARDAAWAAAWVAAMDAARDAARAAARAAAMDAAMDAARDAARAAARAAAMDAAMAAQRNHFKSLVDAEFAKIMEAA